jgi:hypothetical protein
MSSSTIWFGPTDIASFRPIGSMSGHKRRAVASGTIATCRFVRLVGARESTPAHNRDLDEREVIGRDAREVEEHPVLLPRKRATVCMLPSASGVPQRLCN